MLYLRNPIAELFFKLIIKFKKLKGVEFVNVNFVSSKYRKLRKIIYYSAVLRPIRLLRTKYYYNNIIIKNHIVISLRGYNFLWNKVAMDIRKYLGKSKIYALP